MKVLESEDRHSFSNGESRGPDGFLQQPCPPRACRCEGQAFPPPAAPVGSGLGAVGASALSEHRKRGATVCRDHPPCRIRASIVGGGGASSSTAYFSEQLFVVVVVLCYFSDLNSVGQSSSVPVGDERQESSRGTCAESVLGPAGARRPGMCHKPLSQNGHAPPHPRPRCGRDLQSHLR